MRLVESVGLSIKSVRTTRSRGRNEEEFLISIRRCCLMMLRER